CRPWPPNYFVRGEGLRYQRPRFGSWRVDDHGFRRSKSVTQIASFTHLTGWSALPPKADIAESNWHVRFVPKADIGGPLSHWHTAIRGVMIQPCCGGGCALSLRGKKCPILSTQKSQNSAINCLAGFPFRATTPM